MSVLNLARIQSCRWSERVGIVHETVNVIDWVICEATPNDHVINRPPLSGSIPTPAFTASAYAMFSVAKKSCKSLSGKA